MIDIERQEWLESLEWLMSDEGHNGYQTMSSLIQHYYQLGGEGVFVNTPYTNSQLTITTECPKESLRINELIRWNAMAMVVKGTKVASELGGHIASYASSAQVYDVAFEHFFKAGQGENQDCIFFQGHSAPGFYARAFLEGRLTESDLVNFRQEADGVGLSSYPHPRLMPDFWSFPTVSMGLGPLMAIYQARFDRYMQSRGLMDNKNRNVWAFCGDGEMDEPESLGALSIAAREKLDNLIFVVNCNLQRLDGPVRGNGKIIQELEGVFTGNGWRVIKLIWNQAWMQVIQDDPTGQLMGVLEKLVDGQYQKIAESSDAVKELIFSQSSELLRYFDSLPSSIVKQLKWGGHDYQLVHAALSKATSRVGQPTVLLVKTIKGYGLGAGISGANTTHQHKKMEEDLLVELAKTWGIPHSDEQAKRADFYHPGQDDSAISYIHDRRQNLGGYLPMRSYQSNAIQPLRQDIFSKLTLGNGDRPMSTTMAFVRILTQLLREPEIKDRVVPIVPDECRTFGMEGLFRQIGIYAADGQKYDPVDREQLMYYKESKSGQLLQEGINEAGAMSSWIAASCAYANTGQPLIPFYAYYSMFGFQRVGDLAWAAADARARGFLIGATAGRTTLAGEGLQHNDGHSHLLASVIPSCRSYDPAYAYELAVIIQQGIEDMMVNKMDVFYYITVMNENIIQPPMPDGVTEGILKGLYRLRSKKLDINVNLWGSGTILPGVIEAADWLESRGIGSDVYSVTSYNELARTHAFEARKARMAGESFHGYIANLLEQKVTVATSDYIRAVPEQVRAFVPGAFYVLGTDGYGRSDTRIKLREFHEVSWQYIAITALYGLLEDGSISQADYLKYQKELQIVADKPCPVNEGVTA